MLIRAASPTPTPTATPVVPTPTPTPAPNDSGSASVPILIGTFAAGGILGVLAILLIAKKR
jgi:hypothetical protein